MRSQLKAASREMNLARVQQTRYWHFPSTVATSDPECKQEGDLDRERNSCSFRARYRSLKPSRRVRSRGGKNVALILFVSLLDCGYKSNNVRLGPMITALERRSFSMSSAGLVSSQNSFVTAGQYSYVTCGQGASEPIPVMAMVCNMMESCW